MLITLLRAGICNGEIDEITKKSIDENSLESLYTIAQKHDVAHIVADVLFKQKLMPDCDISGLYKYCSMMALIRYQQLSYELKQLCDLFEDNAIPHIPLKGSVIRDYYPEPWYRISCDIDILVKPEDLQEAAELMKKKLGYEIRSKNAHDWGFITESNLHIELHFALIEQYADTDGLIKRKWNSDCLLNVWESAHIVEEKSFQYAMSNELFYFYHMAHMAKHFENGGCGIRPIIDLWLLNNKFQFNKEKATKVLNNGGLTLFANTLNKLSEIWFDNLNHDNFSLNVEEYIFTGGVYGTIQNRVAIKQNKNGGRLKYALNRVFLPYDALKYHFAILQKHKWLYPFCLIARWIKLLFFGGFKRSVNELMINEMIDQNQSQSISELLDGLGL